MSDDVNTIWLESARENFEEAKQRGNWNLAEAVIKDIRGNGFDLDADLLQVELNHDRWADQ